ncbi:LPXTG cell wall anchor domain-containing protein [Vagococcus silagei]|uniref:LPXTG cell wall anchor domain-containing protein n=1 Tax=Vagococcus silagei TaxID=2508885 RepID=A0A4S3B130_9ENTE|nr:LPXTG cell wall anchor domain-containing protein [Vagococcus silagei]THB60731.1 LPXTG cell wall anchor domain-containing protein [Vagococcus silagei]
MKKFHSMLLCGLLLGGLGFSTVSFAEDRVETVNEEKVIETDEEIKTQETTPEQPTMTTSSIKNDKKDTVKKKEIIETEDAIEKVKDEAAKLVGESKGKKINVNNIPTAAEIRKELLSDASYGLSKEEIAKFTDDQLDKAMTIFHRYNTDIIGMDYGSYVKILKKLYVDHTLDAESILAQLKFNPSDFNSFTAMIPQVDTLQTYIKTLYPEQANKFSKAQLIARLKELQKFEDKVSAEGVSLPAGRIALIFSGVPDGYIDETGTTSTTETIQTTTTTSKPKDKVTTGTSKKKDGSLPQTGEKNDGLLLGVVGVFAIMGSGYLLTKNH